MQNSSIAMQTLLCMCLLVPAAQAQDLAPPDMERRQSMNYEEYAKYRESMRQQMGKANRDQNRPAQNRGASPQDRSEMRRQDSAYGQGYRSRDHSDRPNSAGDNRTERHQIERFGREDRGNRK